MLAVSVVKEDALAERVSGNIVESMRGLTSGVRSHKWSAGSNASIIIRGLGSLTNNNPLFIIDGAYGGSDLGVNVEDIESIQILKDASSVRDLRVEGSERVVIVTTNRERGTFESEIRLTTGTQLATSL